VPPAKPPFGQAVHAKLLSMVWYTNRQRRAKFRSSWRLWIRIGRINRFCWKSQSSSKL